tara:strand:+ start:3200 stop:4189 length:990 start_codon:yes stop_codon:yes gene_type:complete
MNDDTQIIKDDEIDIRALFKVFWSERKLIVKIAGGITFLGILYALLATPLYKSTITMYPSGENSGALSQFQGMASMIGMNMNDGKSKFHIPDIINSRTLQSKIIYKKWNTNLDTAPIDLIRFWGINNENKFSINPLNWFSNNTGNKRLVWESSALEKMVDRISIREHKTGLINVDVLMEEPELSAQISNYLYDAVIEFTNSNHNETAKLNRRFIQGRQLEVKGILVSAENKLKEFRSKNRKVVDSPQLQLEFERLLRDVEIQTQIFITLQQQYELARIEEVKEMPSVVILDRGFPSIYKNSPNRKLIVVLSAFIGGFFGIFYILIRRLF